MGLMRNYISQEFKEYIPQVLKKIEEPLATLLICNNNSTTRAWPSAEGLDFTVTRNVLYNFTLKRLDEFISNQEFAFLYQFYYRNGAEIDSEKHKDVPKELIMKEMTILEETAEQVPNDGLF